MMTSKLLSSLAVFSVIALGVTGCAFAPDSGSESVTGLHGIDVVVSEPLTVDDYVAEFGGRGGSLGADGIRDEYWRAALTFPFPLPDGYAFPANPILWGPGDQYEAGYGAADAFMFWSGATATAAWAAHQRGDEETADALLDNLVECWNSPVQSLHVEQEDPSADDPLIDQTIRPARSGNFAPLQQWMIEPFLERDENREIAIAAGDVIEQE